MKRRTAAPGTLRFIFIAVVFMLLADHFVFGDKRSYIETARQNSQKEEPAEAPVQPPIRAEPPEGQEFFEQEVTSEAEKPAEAEPVPDIPKESADVQPPIPKEAEKKPAVVAKPSVHGAPKIAIIIDDVGMDVKRSREAIDLPASVTLAMLPYAPKVRELAQEAKSKGHMLIIHTPMEAVDTKLNIGPGGLRSSMSAEQLDAAFDAMLKSFSGYEGINNHMGSRLTQDKSAMDIVMASLARHNLFFVDSKTIQSSVAAREAASSGVPYAERDVFIDHVETLEAARKALNHTEQLALKRGYAIAIGHPKDHTLQALNEWLPTLKGKGIEVVPVKKLLVVPKLVEEAKAVPTEENEPEPLDMFPEEQAPQIMPSAPASNEPEIQLHPLPTQSPLP